MRKVQSYMAITSLMSGMRTLLLSLILTLALSAVRAPSSFATGTPSGMPITETPPELENVGIRERLGRTVAVDRLTFRNEKGERVPFSSFFERGKPVLLNLVYYQCPSLCTFVLNGLLESLKPLKWTPGEEFELVTLSIDPTEGSELASSKKAAYLSSYKRKSAEKGWHFLTGTEDQIRSLTRQVGFGYKYNEEEQQYAHAASLIVLTPRSPNSEVKISRYLYGIEYPEKDLRLALLEASNGKIGNMVDRLILFCFRYDPHARGYSLVVSRAMQTGAAGMTVLFGGYLAVFWRRQRKYLEAEAKTDSA